MKKYKSSLLILFFISSLIAIIVLPTNVNSQEADINFTFNNDTLFNINNPTINKTFNLANITEFTGHYNATYSFENELNNTQGLDIDWIDLDSSNGNVVSVINNSIGSHNKVLQLLDNDNSGRVHVSDRFESIPQIEGVIEFWIRITDATNLARFLIWHLNTVVIDFRIDNDSFRWVNGGSHAIGNLPIDNTWYHISINFSCITDKYGIRINNILEEDNADFVVATDNITRVNFLTDNVDSGYSVFVDGIGYFFENFNFEGNLIGNEPLLWNVQSFGTGVATVERFQGSNVLRVFDDDINEGVGISTSFSQSVDQQLEFYIAVNDTSLTENYNFGFNEGGSGRIALRIDNDDLDFNNGSDWLSIKDDFIVNNTWFKITLELDDSADTFNIFINDISEGNNLDYILSSTISVDGYSLATDGVQTSTTYLDNFSINSTSFNNYFLGQNLIPFINITERLQPEKEEFLWEGFNNPYEVGDSIPLFIANWQEIDPSTNDVDIQLDIDDSNDRVAQVRADSTNGNGLILDQGLTFNTPEFINILYEVSFPTSTNSNEFCQIRINSSDTTEVVRLNYFPDLNILNYYNGSTTIVLFSNINSNDKYTTNIFVNYEIDFAFISFFINETLNNIFRIPLLTTDKIGFDSTQLITFSPIVDELIVNIDNAELYIGGRAITADFGYIVSDLDISSWNLARFNFFESFINFGSEIHIGVITGAYEIAESITNLNNGTFQDIDFWSSTNNVYLDTIITNPTIVITSSSNISFGNFSFFSEGVILSDGSNEFPLVLNFENVDPRESFFFVDLNNRLQFIKTSDDTNLEFIEAIFDINDVSSTGRAISFESNINVIGIGIFRINFTDTSNLIQLPSLDVLTTRVILTQNETITSFSILITDNDIDTTLGLTTGFVSEVILLFNPNIVITILTLSLIAMIIPLIIISVPSLAISNRFGKYLLIPMFLLMSLICVATFIIPVWIFFIIMYSSSLFIIKRDDFKKN